jgi:hypothetical protein
MRQLTLPLLGTIAYDNVGLKGRWNSRGILPDIAVEFMAKLQLGAQFASLQLAARY